MTTPEILSLSVSVITALLALLYRVTIASLQKDATRHELEIGSLKNLITAVDRQGGIHGASIERSERAIDRLERDLRDLARDTRTSQVDPKERG